MTVADSSTERAQLRSAKRDQLRRLLGYRTLSRQRGSFSYRPQSGTPIEGRPTRGEERGPVVKREPCSHRHRNIEQERDKSNFRDLC
jgi:hypothetical protein